MGVDTSSSRTHSEGMATEETARVALHEGRAAADELAEALAGVGIVLPSLSGAFPTVNGGALVDLGSCSTAVALKLARIVTAARR